MNFTFDFKFEIILIFHIILFSFGIVAIIFFSLILFCFPKFKNIRFVLVGDDYQLPPIVISAEAQSRGMDISLLRRLIEAHPEAATCLTAQYRMNEQIMSVCNTLIYENRMTCATSSVANARLVLPHIRNFDPSTEIKSKSKNWIDHCIDPCNSVVFLNTDSLYEDRSPMVGSSLGKGPDSLFNCSYSQSDHTHSHFTAKGIGTGNGGKKVNEIIQKDNNHHEVKILNIHDAEVNIVRLLVQGLLFAGFDVRKNNGLGIISPYRSQVRALRDTLSSLLKESDMSALYDNISSVKIRGNGIERVQGRQEQRPVNVDTAAPECDVSTVDSFQGRDMDAIIFSTVKNKQGGSVSGVRREVRW